MNFRAIIDYLRSGTLGAVLTNAGIAITIFMIVAVLYFYLYLPGTTNHGQTVQVPDLTGMDIYELDKALTSLHLRYEVSDSSYSEGQRPLTVLAQVPKAGHYVKENRRVYLTINSSSPPTVPLPDLMAEGAGSLEHAEVVLKSAELRRGSVTYRRNYARHLLMEVRYNGRPITRGTRVPKGASIDLVVGDGAGPRDFVMTNLVGVSYENALLRLGNLSLHLGSVQIPDDVDTTGAISFVIKQLPEPGDSVSIGQPIDLWIGPKGYQFKEPEDN
jgi:beta-lactam-binding protein with PASTA domain